MRRSLLAAIGSLSLIAAVTLGPVAAEGQGCRAFGRNVAGLAQALGPDFGATAPSVATSAPHAFVDVVVQPEQEALCNRTG